MYDAPSKAKDVKYKARVADQPPLSSQSQKRSKNKEDEKKRQNATFNHMLEHIKHVTQIFQREEMKYLREFVNHVESWHDIYPFNLYDFTPCPVLFSSISHPLTKNFISQLIANTVHSEMVFKPILQMLECRK